MAPEAGSETRGFLTGWSSAKPGPLVGLLESEQSRIALERARSDARLDAIRTQWELDRASGIVEPSSPFLGCEPMPYTARTQIIGPAGGEIRFGPHALRIPRGALTQYTVITAEALVTSRVEVRLSPHRLQFIASPELIVSYGHCQGGPAHGHRVAYIDAVEQIVEWPKYTDRPDVGELSAWIRHFSRYHIARRMEDEDSSILRGYTPAGG